MLYFLFETQIFKKVYHFVFSFLQLISTFQFSVGCYVHPRDKYFFYPKNLFDMKASV